MKKLFCLILTAALLLSATAACAKSDEPLAEFKQENEIVTYKRLDPEKTTLTVARTGNIDVLPFCEAFEAKNSDIQIVYTDITGGLQGATPTIDWVKNGYALDVLITTSEFFSADEIANFFENLSGSAYVENFEADALKRTAVNGSVYWLPGPSSINAMMYNKTLFAQYGWEAPNSFDEFLTLCAKITEDTAGAVQPWNPNAKYSNELQIVLEAFVYGDIFAGVENRTWYNDFLAGEGDFAGHMEPYFDVIQQLIDKKLLTEEHFSYSATARGKEFAAGQIAMINMVIYDADNEQYDFGYLPFPTTTGELGYICDSYSCFLGIPKKERSEKLQDAVDRFTAYFSSPAGQQDFMGNAMKVSNVKNVPLNQSDDLATLQPVIDAGHMFGMLDFRGVNLGLGMHDAVKEMTLGTRTGADVIATVDAAHALLPAATPAVYESVATVEKDMTVLETSFYIADMYREKAEADIGLIAHNVAYRGTLNRIFAGDFIVPDVAALKPRSFANDSTLIKVSMTGQQILDALNHPVGNDGVADCIYAYSGLTCKVAPWNPLGEKYLSVTLADGSALDPAKTYTVAFWQGTVAEEYITETLTTYEGTWEALMGAKMTADGVIRPANDKRITLIWD